MSSTTKPADLAEAPEDGARAEAEAEVEDLAPFGFVAVSTFLRSGDAPEYDANNVGTVIPRVRTSPVSLKFLKAS